TNCFRRILNYGMCGYEDSLSIPARMFRQPHLSKYLETKRNIRIGLVEPPCSDSDCEYVCASYAQERFIDVNIDGCYVLRVSDAELETILTSSTSAWVDNIALGPFTWRVHFGGADGFDSLPTTMDVPFRSSRIGRNPYIPDGRRNPPSSLIFEPENSAVVDL